MKTAILCSVIMLVRVAGVFAEEQSPEDALRDRMKKIVIPEVDFREADIHDVIEFFTDASAEHSPDMHGVNIILNLRAGAAHVPKNPEDPFDQPLPDELPKVPAITFSARQINLLEALRIVSKVGNLKLRIVGNVAMVVPLNAPEGKIVVRMYNVLPSVEERIPAASAYGGDFRSLRSTGAGTDWKEFFAELGVTWPTGSSIKYVRSIGKFVVSNTPENLERFEQILSMLNITPSQIEIEVSFVSFALSDISRVVSEGVIGDALEDLWREGKGELRASPRVITRSGMEATVKGVTEVIYPTEFELALLSGTNTNALVTASVVEPSGFEIREVGAILSVLPEISVEGTMINLTMSPELVEEPEWRDYGGEVVGSDGRAHHAQMKQPFFHTFTTSTSVSVADGERILVGGGMPSRDGQRAMYMFVRACRVGVDGMPLERPPAELKGTEHGH